MMFPGWGMGGWMMVGYSLVGVLILAMVVGALIVLSRRTSGPRESIAATSAKELLDQRYARGEIDDDEYFRRLSVLDSTRPQSMDRAR
jgi:putative membrane protein